MANQNGTSTSMFGLKGPYDPCTLHHPEHHNKSDAQDPDMVCAFPRMCKAEAALLLTPMQGIVLWLNVGREKLGTMIMVSSSAKYSSCTKKQRI